jgi:hypothetical protein
MSVLVLELQQLILIVRAVVVLNVGGVIAAFAGYIAGMGHMSSILVFINVLASPPQTS